MTNKKEKSNSIVKKIARLLAFFLIFILVVATISWYVLKSNHPFLIQKIQTQALEKYNISLDLEGYELAWGSSFPNLQIKLSELKIANQEDSETPFLKVNSANTQINLWQINSENFHPQPIYLDSVWVHIYKDSLGNKNTDINNNNAFTKKNKSDIASENTSITQRIFPKLKINFLDFHHQNAENKKWQRAQFPQPDISIQQKTDNEINVQFQSDCHFDGLVFSTKDGGYLMNKSGKMDLNFEFLEKEKLVRWKNSSLLVDKMIFDLEGFYKRKNAKQIFINIKTDGVLLKKVLPLLSDKINRVLNEINIDQPIAADFSLDKYLNSGTKGLINLDFSTSDAMLIYRNIPMSSTELQGNFSNDCDKNGIGDFENSCLTVYQLDGDILEILKTKLSGNISAFKNPLVDLEGKMYFDLSSLNVLLAPKDKMTFTKGHAITDFKYKGILGNLLKSPFDEQDIQLQGKANFYDLTVKTDNRYAPAPSLTGQLSFDENQAILDDIFLDWMGSKVALSGKVGNLPEFIFYEDEALNANVNLHFDQINTKNFAPKNQNKTKVNQEESINPAQLESVFRRLASSVNGSIQLQIDSLKLDDLFFTDLKSKFRLVTPRRPEFIDSTMIRVDKLNANFMGKSLVLLDLGLTHDSITNLWVDLKLPSALQPANFFLPKNIEIDQGDATLNIHADIPLRSIFDSKNLLDFLDYRGEIIFKKTRVNTNSVEFPIRQITGPINFDKQEINFDSLKFSYEDSPFLMLGKIDNYHSLHLPIKEKIAVDLKVHGNFLNLKKKKNQTKEKNQTATTTKKSHFSPAEIFQNLDSIFQIATGKIDLRLDSILTDQITIYPFLLQAQLLADEKLENQHKLVVDSFNINFGKQNTIKGSAIINNPQQPFLQAHFKTRMKFNQVGKLLRSDFIEMREGYFVMDLDYQSLLHDTLNAKNYISNAKINGSAEIVDGNIFYNYRDFEFDNIYSHFSFDEKDIFIRDLDLKVNENRIFGSGQSINFFPFFIFPNRRANIEMKLTSPFFDFGKFTAPHGLGKDTLLVTQDTASTDQGFMENAGSLIDQLLNKGSIEISTDIKKLTYQKFLAKSILGKISLKPDSVHLEKLNMNIAKGTFTVDGLISNVARHNPKMEVAIQMRKNDLKELFRQFENFGQTDFGHENLAGDASAEVFFKTKINSNYSILTETMEGDLNLKLSGGQLSNVDFFKTLPKFLTKKRKLEELLIDTVETNIHVRGNNIYLDKMSFRSSAFHFGIQGIYSLNNAADTRILMRVPLSNLYKKYFSEEEIRLKTARRKGLPILIEAKFKKDKLRLRWKLFNSRKSKKRYLFETKGKLLSK